MFVFSSNLEIPESTPGHRNRNKLNIFYLLKILAVGLGTSYHNNYLKHTP